jgi:protein TonB
MASGMAREHTSRAGSCDPGAIPVTRDDATATDEAMATQHRSASALFLSILAHEAALASFGLAVHVKTALFTVPRSVEVELTEEPPPESPTPPARDEPAARIMEPGVPGGSPAHARAAAPVAVEAKHDDTSEDMVEVADAPPLPAITFLLPTTPGESSDDGTGRGGRGHGTGTGIGDGPGGGAGRGSPARLADTSFCGTLMWPATVTVNRVYAHLIVDVAPTGRATSARLVWDPGDGFGPQAVRCALEKNYAPATDARGKCVRGETAPIRVVFDR